ncbi:hypothetical protein ABTL69_19735, partial [Acinetobacter baumannii]
ERADFVYRWRQVAEAVRQVPEGQGASRLRGESGRDRDDPVGRRSRHGGRERRRRDQSPRRQRQAGGRHLRSVRHFDRDS